MRHSGNSALALSMLGLLWISGCQNNDDGLSVSEQAVGFAEANWVYYDPNGGEFGSYLAYEYWVAHFLGIDGELSGTIKYEGTIDQWQTLTWSSKRSFLPAEGFQNQLNLVNHDDQYYRLIGESDQFAAGWPRDGDYPLTYRSQLRTSWQWTATNSYRTAYRNLIGSGAGE